MKNFYLNKTDVIIAFVLVHGVLGLRSSFLGLRFRNTQG